MARTDVEDGLLGAAVAALRPLARRLLAAGVPFGRLEARLRRLFVEVADAEFVLPDRPQTDSRVALLTGINRKEVRRLRKADATAPGPASFSRNLGTVLVSRWMSDPRATDRSGRPIPIPYQAARGPSFVRLARATTVDVAPRALLDGLVAAGAAERRDGGLIALKSDAYVPKRGQAETFAMLAEDPAELIETILHNVLAAGEDLRLQRKVAYDNLGADGLRAVRTQLRREGERFLRRINRLLARHDRDRNPKAPGGERRYAGLGIYYFEAPERPAKAPAARQPKKGSPR
jgi:Family of unknown function (DUF6502)